MPDIPPDDLARARAIIDQLHERLGLVIEALPYDAGLALEFDPEQPE
ncbi:MAG TPA: hypothetical protein VFL57_12420 [Bryobacteraceae bacterium]|nr:hypothetical protein [Bryobacteraceae bacterium]